MGIYVGLKRLNLFFKRELNMLPNAANFMQYVKFTNKKE